MSLPGNGIFVVRGELSILITAMKRGARWSSHSYQDDDLDSLMKSLQELKDVLNRVDDLRFLDPDIYLTPFLNVISEETTGPVTSLALSAVNKFLSYGIIGRYLLKWNKQRKQMNHIVLLYYNHEICLSFLRTLL